jgi:F-type H+-transporting ATPase subunit delta
MLLDKRGILVANITTAHALNSESIEIITKDLKKSLGHKVKVEAKTRRSIIGGIIVRIGSNMIDYSVSTKLHNLKQVMQSARI